MSSLNTNGDFLFEGTRDQLASYLVSQGAPPQVIQSLASEIATDEYAYTKCTSKVIGACYVDGKAGELRRMTCEDYDERGNKIPGSERSDDWCHVVRPNE